jgi:putative membrane-bound dehydrogenase-like protein
MTSTTILAPSLRRLLRPAALPLVLLAPAMALDQAFTINEFAGPPQANYPTAISAAPNGDLYVSSDRNGSLGHAKKMGKIVLCRDTDNDGKADKFIDFVPDIDSPRGGHLVGGTFYVIHPPHLTSYRDTDGDGVADEVKELVDGLGGGIEHPRGADHTTNSVRMGIDGWLYIAVGDFGMFNSKGTDDKHVTLFGGGVARVRPDGSDLEVYSYMTRNIVDIAIAPTMDIFSRDNTNDGKGWNTRFHHFTELSNHGYPRLYQNFKDEAIVPLADFGGGSGTGGLWLDEPGFPAAFTNTLFTCDWTTGNIYHNPVTRENASYTVKQEVFLKLTRAIDIDVDGFSRLYVADWRDGGFDHSKDGKPVGRIQRIVCPGEKAAQYVDVIKAKDAELPKLLASASAVQRLEASREIIARGRKLADDVLAVAKDAKQSEAVRVAAIFTYKQVLGKGATKELVALAGDAAVKEYALRALADRKGELAGVPARLFLDALKDANPRVVLQALIGLDRLEDKKVSADILAAAAPWKDKDGGVSPRLRLTAITVLTRLGNDEALLAAVKDPATREVALAALQHLHRPEVVKGLIAMAGGTDPDLRGAVFGALARLTYQEKPWDLKFWWQTRPDDRGPYYETIAWEETPKIIAALEKGFAATPPAAQGDYLALLAKNRLAVTELKLPGVDPVTLATGMAKPDEATAKVLVQAAVDAKRQFAQRVQAYKALGRVDGAAGLKARIEVLAAWSQEAGIPAEAGQHANDFIAEAERGNQVKDLRRIAAEGSDGVSRVAWACLLNVLGSPLAKDNWKNEVKKIIADNPKEVGFFNAIAERRLTGFDQQIEAALKSDNRKLVEAATAAKAAVGGAPAATDGGKKVAELPLKDVAAAAMAGKGDPEVGKRLFTQQGCVTCHAIDLKAEQKGPYLGAAGAKFTRDYLVDSVLEPSKVVAQGFQTFVLTMKDGSTQTGFITSEIEGVIELRNILGQVTKLKRADVDKETHVAQSMMPPGLAGTLTVAEFTSLVEYLVSLKAKGG